MSKMTRYKREEQIGRNARNYLHSGNPNKFLVLQYLIEIHKKRGDKILIFIDYVDILIKYATVLGYPYISGELKHYEREKILQFFQHLGGDWNVLFLSRVGDVGIDLPDANVAIEVSSLFGSRRQEAQRLGRILRPKEKKQGETYQSYFYTLVSLGTAEINYSFKRQKFLIEQVSLQGLQLQDTQRKRPAVQQERIPEETIQDEQSGRAEEVPGGAADFLFSQGQGYHRVYPREHW